MLNFVIQDSHIRVIGTVNDSGETSWQLLEATGKIQKRKNTN